MIMTIYAIFIRNLFAESKYCITFAALFYN